MARSIWSGTISFGESGISLLQPTGVRPARSFSSADAAVPYNSASRMALHAFEQVVSGAGSSARIVEALRPGGVVVLESGVADPDGPRLNRVLIDPDEMRAAYGALSEIAFEQSLSTSDWGLRELPLVRLAARRDSRPSPAATPA